MWFIESKLLSFCDKIFYPKAEEDLMPSSCPKKNVSVKDFSLVLKGWMEPRCVCALCIYHTHMHMPVCLMFHETASEQSLRLILNRKNFRQGFLSLCPVDMWRHTALDNSFWGPAVCIEGCSRASLASSLLVAPYPNPQWQSKASWTFQMSQRGRIALGWEPPRWNWETWMRASLSFCVTVWHGATCLAFLGFSPISVKQSGGTRWLVRFLQFECPMPMEI